MTAMTPGAVRRKRDGDPLVVGLTGGVACGKSTVAWHLGKLGATVIDADAIAREMLQSPPICDKIRSHWGEALLDAKGLPERSRIADYVFSDPEKLAVLNRWVHPPTLDEMRRRIAKARQDRHTPMIVIDAPLLLETGIDAWCDAVVFIETAESERAQRAHADRHWPRHELARREDRQRSLAEKRRRADYVLNNDGSLAAMPTKVEKLFHALTCSADSPHTSPPPPRR